MEPGVIQTNPRGDPNLTTAGDWLSASSTVSGCTLTRIPWLFVKVISVFLSTVGFLSVGFAGRILGFGLLVRIGVLRMGAHKKGLSATPGHAMRASGQGCPTIARPPITTPHAGTLGRATDTSSVARADPDATSWLHGSVPTAEPSGRPDGALPSLLPLRVRGLDRVQLHADLTILARFARRLITDWALALAA